MIGLYCGYRELEIDDMSYNFYRDLIAEIAIMLQYKSVVHILGRDYADESVFEYVNKCNPFMVNLKEDEPKKHKKLTMKELQGSGLLKT